LACVALTFDDGPGPDTGRLLDILAAKGVHATFFVLGGAANARPELVAREVNEGHAVGNHTWDHKSLVKLDDASFDNEVGQTRDTIAAASGFTPTMVRPPYGAMNDRVVGRLAALGNSTILWNVDSEDWRNKSAAISTQRILDTVKPGAIVLMHDIHAWSVDAVPGIIDALHARGYTLVTVPELLGGEPAPGVRYFSR
jgi:peptidoglycan/xylan/chitin deacetylase (PgdA/CDA1 family)